jgi:translation initiation factor IF-3
MNAQIRVPEVRLVGEEGDQIGVVAIDEALKMADEKGLDLVEISPNAEPPVCRLMDYGKFKYQDSKRKHAAKKKQKVVSVKEIKFRPGTDIGDYNIKLGKLTKFLENGDKVKLTLRFRGREMAHQHLGMELLKRAEADLSELAVVEQYPKMEGRQMVMVMAPKKTQ